MRPKIYETLTESQISGAKQYYNNHKEWVDKIVKATDKSYEPSEVDDKNNPMIWKGEHWKWFLKEKTNLDLFNLFTKR